LYFDSLLKQISLLIKYSLRFTASCGYQFSTRRTSEGICCPRGESGEASGRFRRQEGEEEAKEGGSGSCSERLRVGMTLNRIAALKRRLSFFSHCTFCISFVLPLMSRDIKLCERCSRLNQVTLLRKIHADQFRTACRSDFSSLSCTPNLYHSLDRTTRSALRNTEP